MTNSPSMQRMGAFFALILLVRVGIADEPSKESQRLDSNALHNEIDRTFALPATTLGPRILIFPIVDAGRRVRHDGHLLGYMATLTAHYMPHKRLAMSTSWQQEILADTGCLAHGKELDAKTIELCLAAAETKQYIVPVLKELEPGSNRFTLETEFHGDGVDAPSKVFENTIAAGDLRTIPGVIAEAALLHLGISLSPADRKSVV